MGRNRPTTAELIEAVTEFLATEVDPEVTAPDVKFRLRVARNVLDIVARECRTGLEHDRREEIALQELLGQEFLGKKRLTCRISTRLSANGSGAVTLTTGWRRRCPS